jgi:hypothetical protein
VDWAARKALACPLLTVGFGELPQGAEIDMEAEFLNLGLDIIGLGVFNYKFGSTGSESPVIKVRSRGHTGSSAPGGLQ